MKNGAVSLHFFSAKGFCGGAIVLYPRIVHYCYFHCVMAGAMLTDILSFLTFGKMRWYRGNRKRMHY